MKVNDILNPLHELFSLQGDKVVFDKSNAYTSWAPKASMADFSTTYTLQGNAIYSIADLQYNNETRDMLYKMKLNVPDEELYKFLDHIAEEVAFLISTLKVEYIVRVPSSSVFLSRVVAFLAERHGVPEASFLSIRKTPIQDIKFNKRSPHLEGMDREDIAEIKQQVMKHIQHQINDDNEYLEAKRFPKNLLGFITGFFQVSGDAQQLRGKRVLIIDDNLSSGNTMKDIVDMFKIQYECEPSGLVFFKLKM